MEILTKPTIEEKIGGYLITWPEYSIEAKISRLNVHQDGHVTGMLSISHNNGSLIRLLPNTQFNFSSDITRAKQAKQLSEKYSGNFDCQWTEMFDYIGESVQSAALAGVPAVEIYADEEAEAPPLLVNPLIYQGHQNILYGEKGVNKSTLAYALAVFMARPDWDNPLSLPILINNPMQSLVLDWETDQRTFEWYLGRLSRGMKFGPVPIYYRHCRLPLAQDIESIAEDIERTGARHLIIDSLGAAAAGESGELKGSQSALEFNSALRKLPGVTATIIGQTAKNTDNSKKTVFGSTYFTYYARNIFELCRAESTEPGVLHLGLFHRECNFAMKSAPIGIKITYGEKQSINMEREELNIAEFSEKVSATQKILNILKSGPANTKTLIQRTGEKRNTIDKALERLRTAGKIDKFDDEWERIDDQPSDEN